MKIAITGGSGYVGSCLIKKLEKETWVESILSIDLNPPNIKLHTKTKYVIHDLINPFDDVLSKFKPDVLIHLSFVLKPTRNRKKTENVNLNGTLNALQAAKASKVKQIIYFSSTTIYGAYPDNPKWLNENSTIRPAPRFQYAVDKAKSELLFESFASDNKSTKILILRGCPVMGPNANNFISNAFAKPLLIGIRKHDPPMQFIHEDDVVNLMEFCMINEVSGTYNVAGDGTITWSEMAKLIRAKMISLPASLLYSLTEISWQTRLQSESSSSGLDFIKYRWTASAQKLKETLRYQFTHSSHSAWQTFCDTKT
ncbi:MAG: hypothetical protein CL904_03765 [Dehalococcoidia bacterium]|nr:hypothetical protein [Dehalococcoidia bacterium]MQG15820.1 NAD-dependent epimerase/dehydratase family protein [SAR202 cluster bacterium]|tara:strand:+ start:34936 stop:35871 length:936 start_codon:yes stop_codon:yes gene_type:complete